MSSKSVEKGECVKTPVLTVPGSSCKMGRIIISLVQYCLAGLASYLPSEYTMYTFKLSATHIKVYHGLLTTQAVMVKAKSSVRTIAIAHFDGLHPLNTTPSAFALSLKATRSTSLLRKE